jgi:dephospho-CoA kinase
MILGITGGIATGKSVVTQAFRALGAAVVSADELAREVVRPGSTTLQRLVKHFGPSILREDGTLNRAALADLIFSDSQARKDLNGITHPAIARLAEQRLKELVQEGKPLIVYEAPLLFEAGAEQRVDAVLVVKVDDHVQLQRLMARDGISEAEAKARISAQMSQQEKASRADYLIDNSNSLGKTVAQVKSLFKRLVNLSENDR